MLTFRQEGTMVVEISGSKLGNISFEDLAEALDKDPAFRDAVSRHIGTSSSTSLAGRNQIVIETKATFALDDSRIFDLNGKGLTVTSIASN